MPKKYPQNVVMKNANDQKYYDALCAMDDFDINNVKTLKNLVTFRGNDSVKAPFYDPNVAKISLAAPDMNSDGSYKDGDTWQPPHAELLKQRLPLYVELDNLYYYPEGASVPKHIEFTTNEQGEVTARVAEQNAEQAQPRRPESPSFLHWLGYKLFGLCKDEFNEYDRKLENYEQQCKAKEFFISDKGRKEKEVLTEKERQKVDEELQTQEEQNRNLSNVYGPTAMPLKNNPELKLGTDTDYRVPEGFTPEMTQALVRLNTASAEIARHNHTDPDDPDYHRAAAVIHGTEDVVAARKDLNLRMGDSVMLARRDVKNALEKYQTEKNPEQIGKIIGGNMWAFANQSTQALGGFSSKLASAMRSNVAILDMLEQHPDIYKSARENGLSMETVKTLQAQRNLVNIYDKNLQARQMLLSDQTERDPQLMRECMADVMMYNVVSKMIDKRASELSDRGAEIYGAEMRANIKNGMDQNEALNICTMKSMNDKLTAEAPEWFKSMSDSALTDVLRGTIMSTKKFKDFCEAAQTDGVAKTLNNKAKINSVAGELMTGTFGQQGENVPGNAPAQVNVVRQGEAQLGGQDAPQAGGN